jgi:hypothetical protein
MKARTSSIIVTHLEMLSCVVGPVSIAFCLGRYEVSVFPRDSRPHGHFSGATLAEAVNRAVNAMLRLISEAER